MTITTLPAVPLRSQTPEEFAPAADTFLAALPQLVTELNNFIPIVNNSAQFVNLECQSGQVHLDVIAPVNTISSTVGINLYTNIPSFSGNFPVIHLEGMDYRNGKTFNISISWYGYSTLNEFLAYSISSYGASCPLITLSNLAGKVVIHISANESDLYHFKFNARAYDINGIHSHYSGWTVNYNEAVVGTNQTPLIYENTFDKILSKAEIVANVGVYFDANASTRIIGKLSPIAQLDFKIHDIKKFSIDEFGQMVIGQYAAYDGAGSLQFPAGSNIGCHGDNYNFQSGCKYVAGWKFIDSVTPALRYEHLSGSHTWYSSPAGTIDTTITFTQVMKLDSANNLIIPAGIIIVKQPTPISKSSAATLTIVDLKTSIIQYTGAVANLTLPTGTDIDAGFPNPVIDTAFDFYVINTGSGIVTLVTNTGLTLIGSMAIAIGGGGAMFRVRRTATNSYTIYRVS